MFRKTKQQRIDQIHNHHAAQPEEDQVSDPDPAMQVHGLLAVIPPTGMEAFLQNIARHIFQEAAQKERHRKGRADGKFQRGQAFYHNGDQCRAGAVDRKPRAGQKTAVDEPMELEILQSDFNTPTEKSVCEKQQYEIDKTFCRHYLNSFVWTSM